MKTRNYGSYLNKILYFRITALEVLSRLNNTQMVLNYRIVSVFIAEFNQSVNQSFFLFFIFDGSFSNHPCLSKKTRVRF